MSSQGDVLFRKVLKGLPTSLLAALVDAELDDPIVLRSCPRASAVRMGSTREDVAHTFWGRHLVLVLRSATSLSLSVRRLRPPTMLLQLQLVQLRLVRLRLVRLFHLGLAALGRERAESALEVLCFPARLGQHFLLDLKLRRVVCCCRMKQVRLREIEHNLRSGDLPMVERNELDQEVPGDSRSQKMPASGISNQQHSEQGSRRSCTKEPPQEDERSRWLHILAGIVQNTNTPMLLG